MSKRTKPAKRSQPEVSITSMIRQYLLEHPDAMPTAAAQELEKQLGRPVRVGAVSNVKYELRKSGQLPGGEPTPRSQPAKAQAAPVAAAVTTPPRSDRATKQQVTLNDLLAAQDLLEKLDWDVERLLAAVDGLKTLRRPR